MVDTSILIDYYRKTDKNNSAWVTLIRAGYEFTISSITKYEIYAGATPAQISFWDKVFQMLNVIAFDEVAANNAVLINSSLKKKRKQIDIADLFIAATAITHNFPLATLNKKHFERIDSLLIIN